MATNPTKTGQDIEQLRKRHDDLKIRRAKAEQALQSANDNGQIRQFTGNNYAQMLALGDIKACIAWSGEPAGGSLGLSRAGWMTDWEVENAAEDSPVGIMNWVF